MPRGIIFHIDLVNWTGRAIRDDKRGSISATALQILQRLDTSPGHWLDIAANFESRFKGTFLPFAFAFAFAFTKSSSELLYFIFTPNSVPLTYQQMKAVCG